MKPWTSGPRELLEHAIDHFEKGSAFDYRIAFISIDNSVELMIKTYLGLPKRIRKLDGPTRRKLSEASNSFPELLDLLDEFGSDKLEGIELGDIEWYHRIRNTLYHDGNGVTVDKEKVDSYLQISIILFNSLFTEAFNAEAPLEPASVVGEIVLRSSQLEHNLNILYNEHFPEGNGRKVPITRAVQKLSDKGVLPKRLVEQINESRIVRNDAVHNNTGDIDVQRVKKAADILFEIATKVVEFM
jgi:uncharacterized protein YutE (UPF0331/DUF86 family)